MTSTAKELKASLELLAERMLALADEAIELSLDDVAIEAVEIAKQIQQLSKRAK